ncbi:hypothetical protein DXG01_015593 [Tephrocybe rancida]|nr:hypothetical protein DXG01_015593 [Tephrocybe rancida]
MRFFVGIGIGAEYPCGSVAATEQSEGPAINKNARHRWFMLATVVTTLAIGTVVAAFTTWVLYLIFGPKHLAAVWRLSLGLGMVPALGIILWRLNMDEPVRYKTESMRDTRIPYKLVIRRYWAALTAISVVWFILDIIVSVLLKLMPLVSFRIKLICIIFPFTIHRYPFGIYAPTILDNITGGSEDLGVIFGWNIVIKLSIFSVM